MVERFNDGHRRNGRIAWVLVIIALTLASAFAYLLIWRLHPVLALLFNIAVLYLTMGFRQESHFSPTSIWPCAWANSIGRGSFSASGGAVATRCQFERSRAPCDRTALIGAHRNVLAYAFGSSCCRARVGLCFTGWPGSLPRSGAGAVMRNSATSVRLPGARSSGWTGFHKGYRRRIFDSGDFEDAIFCWRTQSLQWPDHTDGILIASGAGALGVRLGMPGTSRARSSTGPRWA